MSLQIAFKFSNGSKEQHSFATSSNVKDMYRFVLSCNDSTPIPFILMSFPAKRMQISFELLTDHGLKGSLVIVQPDLSIDTDKFLDMLDEEPPSLTSNTSLLNFETGDNSDYLKSIGCAPGAVHEIDRNDVYNDVLRLYEETSIIYECPIEIKFIDENGIDIGGVTRDMYSTFWEEAYGCMFEEVSAVILLIHPQTRMKSFETLGKVISHGYLVCGHFPIKVSLPVILSILLGPGIDIPCAVLLDAFKDYINPYERDHLSELLTREESYQCSSVLMNLLSRYGCRQIPTFSNLCTILVDVARYEFLQKAGTAILLMHQSIPKEHQVFWQNLGVHGIVHLYNNSSVSQEKVLKILTSDCSCASEERVFGYLQSFISKLNADDLRNFVRFCTGSSVLITDNIRVIYNSSSGFTRAPCAHICTFNLELPTSYVNYHDFSTEWNNILCNTDAKWKWQITGL
jgi:hypothetical protein